MLRQIGSILRHGFGVVVIALAEHEPANMRPPGAVTRRMRIALLIRILMMNAMRGNPENWATFQS